VGNERYLTALYLLTVADIRGTSPKVWNAWKGKLLEDLYRYTLRALGGGTPDPNAEIEARKHEALVQLQLFALPFEAHKKLWDTLDVGYFMRHEAGDIAWHTRHCRATSAAPRRSCGRACRRWAKACRSWSTRPTSPTCSRASAATSTRPASASWTRRSTPPATAMRWTPSRSSPR
jgi:hypothetical protein